MTQFDNIQVSEGVVVEPVTLDDVKTWITIDFTDHDDLLTGMIKSARRSIEKLLNLSLVTKTVTIDMTASGEGMQSVVLPYTNSFASAPTINELDSEDNTTALTAATDFFVRGNVIRIASGRYSVSYTTVPGTIPEDLKDAIKMEVANRYKFRGENNKDSQGLSEEAKAKAEPYKIPWL